MPKRSARGTGSVFKRKHGSHNNLWAAKITIKLPSGKNETIWGYGATQKAAIAERSEKVEQAIKENKHSGMSVEAFMTYWLKDFATKVQANSRSIRTYGTYESNTRIDIIPYIGKIQLDKLNKLDIQNWLNLLQGKKSPATARKSRACLNAALNDAVEWELLNRSPISKKSHIKEHRPDIEVWTEQQLTRFLKEAYTHKLYSLFYTSIATGMRFGELRGLRWQDIDLDHGYIMIRKSLKVVRNDLLELAHSNPELIHVSGNHFLGEPKTKKSKRDIPLAGDVIQVLAKHFEAQQAYKKNKNYEDFDLVFPTPRGTPDWNIRREYKKIIKRAGVPDARFHDQRDLHASIHIANRGDIAKLSKRLGHSRISTTWDRYVRVFERTQEEKGVSLAEFTS